MNEEPIQRVDDTRSHNEVSLDIQGAVKDSSQRREIITSLGCNRTIIEHGDEMMDVNVVEECQEPMEESENNLDVVPIESNGAPTEPVRKTDEEEQRIEITRNNR